MITRDDGKVRSWLTMPFSTSPPASLSRRGAIESISSMKMILPL
jgi:hypothetical protein